MGHNLITGWFARVKLTVIGIRQKVKWSRYRSGVAQRVGRRIALLFHDRGTRRGWVVSSTPRPHFTPGERSGTHFTEGWVGPRSWSVIRNHLNYCIGAFVKLGITTKRFVMPVCETAWNNSAPTGRIFMEFDIWGLFFSKNLSREFSFH